MALGAWHLALGTGHVARGAWHHRELMGCGSLAAPVARCVVVTRLCGHDLCIVILFLIQTSAISRQPELYAAAVGFGNARLAVIETLLLQAGQCRSSAGGKCHCPSAE